MTHYELKFWTSASHSVPGHAASGRACAAVFCNGPDAPYQSAARCFGMHACLSCHCDMLSEQPGVSFPGCCQRNKKVTLSPHQQIEAFTVLLFQCNGTLLPKLLIRCADQPILLALSKQEHA